MRASALFFSIAVFLTCGAAVFAAEPLPTPRGAVILTISGKIENTNAPGEARFDKEMLEALGQASIATHTVWYDQPQTFEGVPLAAVLERVGAKGKSMVASALNDYKISIPFEDLKFNPLLAMQSNGKLLSVRDKGPLWIVYPRDEHKDLRVEMYDSRWVWQLNRLHVE